MFGENFVIVDVVVELMEVFDVMGLDLGMNNFGF